MPESNEEPKAKNTKGSRGRKSWQQRSGKDRSDGSRRVNNVNHRSRDRKEQDRKRADAYRDHPKDKEGNNVCWAKKADGTHCMSPAGKNTNHEGYGKCSFHGGNTPTLSRQAAYFAGTDAIDKMTMSYGYGAPVDISPTEALLQEVQRSAGHVFWLQDRIGLWQLVDGRGELSKPITPVQEQWLELYHRERQHLAKVSKMALDAGVAERKIQLAERQGEIMVTVLNRVFDQLGLTLEQRRLLPEIVPLAIRDATQPAAQFAGELGQNPENKL